MSGRFDVPFIALDRHYKQYQATYGEITSNVLSTGQWGGASGCEQFERKFTIHQDVGFATAVNSGTDALLIALAALQLPPGAGVLVPAFGFIATASTVLLAGYQPIFVDVLINGNIDPNDISKRCNDTDLDGRALIGVDMFGMPCDRKSLQSIAEVLEIPIIYDCAQSLGSYVTNNQMTGSGSLMSCFSFDPMKNLPSTHGGGMVTCSDQLIDFFLKGMRHHGDGLDQPGYNTVMASETAYQLAFKLEHLHMWNEKRRSIAARYYADLHPLKQKGLIIVTEYVDNWSNIGYISNFHKFVIRTDHRNELKQFLANKGIETKIHYDKILPKYSMFNKLTKQPADFYVADTLSEQCLSLPIYPEMYPYEIDHVTTSIINFFK